MQHGFSPEPRLEGCPICAVLAFFFFVSVWVIVWIALPQ